MSALLRIRVIANGAGGSGHLRATQREPARAALGIVNDSRQYILQFANAHVQAGRRRSTLRCSSPVRLSHSHLIASLARLQARKGAPGKRPELGCPAEDRRGQRSPRRARVGCGF